MYLRSYMHIADDLMFPEGPAFSNDGSLWCVELKGESLVNYRNGCITKFNVGGGPNGLAKGQDENLWFCDAIQNSIRRFDPVARRTVTVITHVNSEILTKPNDLAFDTAGNLVFTCPGESRKEPTGYVCVLTADGRVKKVSTGKYFPNGLAFNNETGQLIVAETYKHRLWIGDWDSATCEWKSQRVWCETGGPDGPGGPDGMAFSREGDLFVAVYGTGKIKIINGDGKIFDEITLDGNNPTNCAFDPSGKLGLIVTEAERGVLLSVT